jgi:hypothetical protein
MIRCDPHHEIQDATEWVPGWVVGHCLKCGEQVSITLEKWARIAKGPHARMALARKAQTDATAA